MIGIAIIVLLIAIVIFFATRKNLISLNYTTYETKLENKDSFILYLGAKDCSHCQTFRPTLEKIMRKYRLEIFYLDVSTLTKEEYAKVENKTHLKGTPTVVFIEQGKLRTSPRIQGEMPYYEAVEIFKESGYIN